MQDKWWVGCTQGLKESPFYSAKCAHAGGDNFLPGNPPQKNPRRNALGGSLWHNSQNVQKTRSRDLGDLIEIQKPNFILDGFSRPNHPKAPPFRSSALHLQHTPMAWKLPIGRVPRGCHDGCRPSRTSCCYAYGRHPRCSRTPSVERRFLEVSARAAPQNFRVDLPPQKYIPKTYKNNKQYIDSPFGWSISTTNHLHPKF